MTLTFQLRTLILCLTGHLLLVTNHLIKKGEQMYLCINRQDQQKSGPQNLSFRTVLIQTYLYLNAHDRVH